MIKSRHLGFIQSTTITNIDRWFMPLQYLRTGMETQSFPEIVLSQMASD